MKKFYTLALAAICALGASAATKNSVTITNATELNTEAVSINLRTAVKKNSPAKVKALSSDYDSFTWESIGTGKYAASVVADTYGGSNDPVDVEVYEAKESAGVYKLVGVWPDIIDDGSGELIIDASNPDFVTVPKQCTYIEDDVDGMTYIASQTWTLTELKGFPVDVVSAGAPDLLPIFSDGVITFPVKSLVLNWPDAPEDSKYKTDPESWYVGDNDGYFVLPGSEYVDPWTFVGKGTVSGDLMYSLFDAEPIDYEVEVYVATANPCKYKIKDFLNGLYTALNIKGLSPDFEIDATDADNVSIPLQSTNLNAGAQLGLLYFCTKEFGYKTPEECPEMYRAKLTDSEETTIFTFPPSGTLVLASTAEKILNGNSTEITITVNKSTAGVDNVAVDSENAPVEYYNLLGNRVTNPAKGQIIIKRQGSVVTKMIVK